MKRLLTFLLLVLLAQAVWAQNSTKLSYQAVVRNANNELVANVPVTVEVSILDATSGTTWYTETHSVTTNANGLITLMIGEGTPVSGNLKDVAWDNASIKTSIGAGGENIDNTTAVNAVPYALHADSAKTVNREVLNEQIHEITDQAIANLNQRINTTNVKVDNLGQKLNDTLGYYASQQALVDTAAAIRSNMAAAQVNADWGETDENAASFIKNKPTDLGDFSNTPGYVTAFEVQEAANIPTKVSAFINDAHYVNKDVDSLTYYVKKTEMPDLSGYLTTETDPNVPDWAKAANKPAYDYSEITNTPTIPTLATVATTGNYSDLNGKPDLSGYLTTETDPNVPDWAKAANKPAYNYSEIANTPDLSGYLTSESDPTVNDVTISFTQGNAALGSFTTNATTGTTINIPEAPAQVQSDWNATEGAAVILNKPTDLSAFTNTPGYVTAVDVQEAANIPTKVSAFQNDAHYVNKDVDSLTYYAKLTDLPTVNDATLTIKQGDNELGTFTANAAEEKTITIPEVDLSDYAKTEDIPDVTGFLTTETDPNVPAWAKETNKPAYDYSEIANTPDLTGYLTTETDPTVKDATITFTQGESTLGTFTTNAGTDVTIAIPEATIPAETDPTVPDWAKEANKPAYDYSEIANTPDLSGYLTSETDPNVPAWAKEANKPAYDYSEIANTPDLSGYLTSETDPNVPAWAKEANKPAYDYSEIANTPDLSGYLTTEADPTVKNTTITFTQGETTLGSFTTNTETATTIEIPAAPAMVQAQADWNETDESAASFIKNKPEISATSEYNEACLSTTFCELVNTVNKLLTTVDSLKDVIANLNNNATPTVTTNTTVEFDHGQATVGGNVTNAGFGELTERGICYGTSENPTVEGSKVVATGTTTGAFTCLLSGLETDQKYYARAYATNAAGTTYGDNVEFTIYEDPQLSMVEVTVAATGTITAQANLAQEGINTITELGICWGTTEDIDPDNDGSTKVTAIALGDYTLTLEGEFTEGTYYVRAYAKTAEGVFTSAEYKTFTITAPEVTTGTATVVDGQMQLNGELTKLGTPAATEMGVCWGTTAEPNVEGDHQAASAVAEGEYSVTATNLTAGTYNARAYATYAFGTVYGDAVEFTISAPVVTTGADPVVDNEGQKVTVSGNVTDAGSAEVTKRGICYGTTAEPDTTNKVAAGTGTGEFSATLTDLTAGVIYYARAYAVNAFGVAYGEEVTFQLIPLTPEPVVTTGTATYNSGNGSIAAAGEVVSAGLGGEVTERGICYGVAANPTVEGSKVSAESAGTGEFTVTLTGMAQNTKYYVRAYATNDAGTSYGEDKTVIVAWACEDNKAVDIDGNEYATVKIGTQCWMAENLRVKSFIHPTTGVKTPLKEWTVDRKNSPGNIDNFCYAEATENSVTHMGTQLFYPWATATTRTSANTSQTEKIRGLCPEGWHIPSYTEYTKLFEFVDTLGGLTLSWNKGTSSHYTTNGNFKIGGKDQSSNNNLSVRLGVREGYWVGFSGGAGCIANAHGNNKPYVNTSTWADSHSPGYAYHTDPDNAIWEWNKVGFNALPCGYVNKSATSGTAQENWYFNGTLNLWTSVSGGAATTANAVKIACYQSGPVLYTYSDEGKSSYSVRCVNDDVFSAVEGENVSPATQEMIENLPTVATGTATVADNVVTVTGNVISAGEGDLTSCGVCYGTSSNPTVDGTKATATPGTGEFSCTISSGLQSGTYYARAFATNGTGTVYGEETTFTVNAPSVSTDAVEMGEQLEMTGSVSNQGSAAIAECGFCYSTTNSEPTIADSHVAATYTDEPFSASIESPIQGKTYHVRAYAKNSLCSDYSYGEVKDVEIPITDPKPLVSTDAATLAPSKDVIVTGTVISKGDSELQERGIWYTKEEGKEPNIDEDEHKAAEGEPEEGEFTVTLSGLDEGDTYYFFAYAINEDGISYGEAIEFVNKFTCGRDKLGDICDNEYTTVQIGTQCWMAEDLRVTKLPNGTNMTKRIPVSAVGDYYEATNLNGESIVLYPWRTAANRSSANTYTTQIQGICPTGWHLPSYVEWGTLFKYIDPDFAPGNPTGSSNQSTTLNSTGKLGIKLASPNGTWVFYPDENGTGAPTYSCPEPATPETGATYKNLENTPGYTHPYYNDPDFNTYGFNSMPNGYMEGKNSPYVYHHNGAAYYWTNASYSDAQRSEFIRVNFDVTGIMHVQWNKNGNDYNSVRCLKD